MTQNTEQPQKSYLKRIAFVLVALVVLVYIVKILIGLSSTVAKIELALTPPVLPSSQWESTEELNPIGWPNQNPDWFRFATQGASTLPIPYDWFIALEEPRSHPLWALLGGAVPLFTEEHIYGHGFIKTDQSKYNPDSLPIGFTKTPSFPFKGIDRRAPALGLTCATCHTGQFTHKGTRYIVDGGAAVTDLGLFTESLGVAIGQTHLSGKFGLFDGRFNRFAKRVLGNNDDLFARAHLKDELAATIKSFSGKINVIKVNEGFTRNDALNRIGNEIFKTNANKPKNYHAIDSPVTYPHIWTTSWFDWIQYDGSIMQPLVRNTGEALGLKSYQNTTAPDDERFSSSINMHNLHKLEDWVGGTNPKLNGDRINGLHGPKWPASLPKINSELVGKGKDLYGQLCAQCHLPAMDSPEFWGPEHWKPIAYYSKDGEYQETDQPYLALKITTLDEIGTDPGQAKILMDRTLDTTGLNIDSEVCTSVSFEKDGETITALKYVSVKDSATANFGLALGANVGRTIQRWFDLNYIPSAQQEVMKGGRPNCLQAGKGYKARPLDGVWATAPFLHNGSVATLYDLLTPAKDRPTFIEVGNLEFDPEKVGIVQSNEVNVMNAQVNENKLFKVSKDYSAEHYSLLDTRKAGNLSSGHSFEGGDRDGASNGVIGRSLSEDEKRAIIEYLKSI